MSQKFPIREIVRDERCQARVKPDPDISEEYANAYRAKAKMPPIEVFIVDGAPYVVDGWHRLAGAIKAEVTWITCDIVGTGTIDEAIWKAVAANQTHGYRRSNEDKRNAVRLALESQIGIEQSSRVIAEHLGVSDKLVSELRAEREEARRQVRESAPEPVKRTGKDGKSYTVKPKAPKPEPAPEPVAVDYPVEDDVPLPHEPEASSHGLPPHGPELLRCAALAAKFRRDMRAAALPHGTLQRIESDLKQFEYSLRADVPETCPRCNGATCKRCGWLGWVTKSNGDSLRRADEVSR